MKKVLSLILALAMVFTMMPLAFAGDEDVQTVYDVGEAFAVKETFTGNMAVDYPNKSFTPAYDGDEWQIGYYALAKGDNYAIDNGIETFVPFTKLHRAQGAWARMKEDTVNTYTFADPSKSHDIVHAPVFYEEFWGSGSLAEVTADWSWSGLGTVKITGTATVDDGEGATTTKASDGYKQAYANGHIGTFGYTYGSAFDGNIRTSSTGYFSNSGAAMKAAIFTAPRAGLINVTLAHYAQNADRVVYQLYKLDASGNKTMIYPSATDTTTTFSNTFGTTTYEWTVPEKWKDGWGILSNTSDNERNDGNVWVNKGDQLIIRYAAINVGSQDFNLSKLIYTYQTSLSGTYTGEYKADRTVDLTKAFTLPLDGGSIVVDSAVLTATATAGVYTLADSYVDGTATIITLTNGSTTETLTAKFSAMPMEYDVAEAFYTTDTYTEGYTYGTAGQTPKNANNGTGIWSVGYYQMNGTSKLGDFHYYGGLYRSRTNNRAYEDTVNTDKIAAMAWAVTGMVKKTDDLGSYLAYRNGNPGAAGYSFGVKDTLSNTSIGYPKGQLTTYVFKAPRDGVVNPQLSVYGANTINYRVDKIKADGTVVTIYPTNDDASRTWIPNDGSSVPAGFEKWGILTGSWLDKNDEYVRVEKGDQIVTYFSGQNAGHIEFSLATLKMVYVDSFDDDEEVFQHIPFEKYDAETEVIYPTQTTVDFRRTLNNADAKKSTITYSLSGNTEALRATATAGVYAVTGTYTNGTPAVVTATYANGSKTFTSATKVEVKPLSANYSTFDGEYGIFKSSDCGYDFDSYILPYYASESERNLYGTIDLGLNDAWANATVTFDQAGKFEYLGNGRIRAIASYTFAQAGGAYHAPTETTVKSYTGATNLKSARDKAAMGTPVVMTVTAADGGTKQFGLWSFPAAVNATTNEDGDVTYALSISGSNQISNPVISVEGYNSETGKFKAAYLDMANGNTALSPLADEQYTTGYFWSGPSITSTNLYFPVANNYYQNYISNKAWHNITGLSRTFTAPRDGEVTVSKDYIPNNLAVDGGCWFVDNYFTNHGEISFDVILYNADDTKVATLYHANYEKNAEDVSGTSYGMKVTNQYFYGDESETYSTVSGLSVSFDTDKNMTLSLEKGQKIRVITNVKAVTTSAAYFTFGQGNAAKTPTFTYKALGDAFEATETSASVMATVADASILNANGTFGVFYDVNGNILEVVPVDDNYGIIDTESGECGFTYEYAEGDTVPAYAKIFFWDDLNNIKPLAGDVLLK